MVLLLPSIGGGGLSNLLKDVGLFCSFALSGACPREEIFCIVTVTFHLFKRGNIFENHNPTFIIA